MNSLKRLCTSLAIASLLAGLVATAPAVVLADDSLSWNGVNGATACKPDTTGNFLWIFNPHGTAEPQELWIDWGSGFVQASGTWTNSGGGQNWHFTTPILGQFSDIVDAYVVYTGDLGDNPILTISGCNEGGGGNPPAADLTITKDAAGTYDRECSWTISKDVDRTSVEISGGTATFNYTVTVSATCDTIKNAKVTGKITVTNPNGGAVIIDTLTDELSDGTDCVVTPDPAGASIPANGFSEFTYECDVSQYNTGGDPGPPPPSDLVNTATVSWSHQILTDDSELSAGTTFFDFDVAFTEDLTDDCVDVTDTLDGTQNDVGEFCTTAAGDSTDFLYSRTFPAPSRGTCVDHDNTASFADNSDPQQVGDSDEVTVSICNFAAALTPGYWKNHLANSGSGLFTDGTCTSQALKQAGGSCSKLGPWTKQYLSVSLNGYTVDTILKAAQVFNKMNCSSTKDNDAVGCLAGHLLATKLNVANGSNPCINTAIAQADAFLTGIGYTGPSGSYSLTKTQRAAAIVIKNALDKYNNGGGC